MCRRQRAEDGAAAAVVDDQVGVVEHGRLIDEALDDHVRRERAETRAGGRAEGEEHVHVELAETGDGRGEDSSVATTVPRVRYTNGRGVERPSHPG